MLSLLLLGFSLSACQNLPMVKAPADSPVRVGGEAPMPFAEPAPPSNELDEDLVYAYLVGEIGSRAGELEVALKHYLLAAALAKDPYAAERATRIALHLKDYDNGIRAARRWVELAPNSAAARQLAALMFLRSGDSQQALEQLRAVLRIAEVAGSGGMLQIAATLNAEKSLGAEVLRLMRMLVSEHADDARAHYALGVVEAAREQLPEAEASLNKAIALQPSWAQPRVLLSKVLVSLGREQAAIAGLQSAVASYPDNHKLRLSYARLLVGAEQYDEALTQFRTLHAQGDLDHEVTYGYAILATQQQAWDEASEQWQVLRGEAQFSDEASYFLAQVEEETGDPETAIGLYLSVQGGEYKVDAQMRAAHLMGTNGRLSQARELLAQARVTSPERAADTYVTETQLLEALESEPAVVLAVYAEALKAHPESNTLQYNRGLYQSDLEDFAAMEADFQAVLARDPQHAESLNALGFVLADRGERLDEALIYIRKALQLRPENAAILDSMGWVHYRLGNFAEAVKYLSQAAEVDRDHEIAAHLIEVLWVSGERDAARELLDAALQDTPDSQLLRAVQEQVIE